MSCLLLRIGAIITIIMRNGDKVVMYQFSSKQQRRRAHQIFYFVFLERAEPSLSLN